MLCLRPSYKPRITDCKNGKASPSSKSKAFKYFALISNESTRIGHIGCSGVKKDKLLKDDQL